MRPKTFFYVLKNSFTNIKYYLDVLKTPLSFSFRFFLISFLIISLFSAIRFSYFDLPIFKQQLETSINDIKEYYPQDLVIKYENKLLNFYSKEADQLNTRETMEIDYPEYIDQEQLRLPKKLLVLTNQEIEIEEIKQTIPNSAVILATPNKFYLNSQGQWQDFGYEILPGFDQEFEINNENINQYIQIWQQVMKNSVEALKYLAFIFLPFILIISRLWIGFIDCLFVYFFLKIGGSKFSFKNTFAWGLHIMVIAELVNQISKTIYSNLTLPMFTFTFWGAFLYIAFSLRHELNRKKIK